MGAGADRSGDLPLNDSAVREALLGSGLIEDDRTIANYRSLAELEIVNNDQTSGTARRQDLERTSLVWGRRQPARCGTRGEASCSSRALSARCAPAGAAGQAPLKSGPPQRSGPCFHGDRRRHDRRGAGDPGHWHVAVEVIPGQGHNKPARYYLSTRLTHRMLVNNIRRTITEDERDEVIAEFAQRLSSTGPFRELRFVDADGDRTPAEVLATAGIDTAHTTRLVVLDPAQFSLRNGSEQSTVDALTVATGLGAGTTQLPVQWASSCVFAVVNTQRRSNARGMAVEYVARKKALAAPEIQADDELKATGTKELAAAKEQLEKAI